MNSVIKVAGIVILALMVLKSSAQGVFDKFRIGSIRLDVAKATLQGIQFVLNVPITNPLPVGLPLDSFFGVIRYGNLPIADVSIANPITIQSGEDHIYKVNGTINYDRLAGNLITIIQSGQYKDYLFLDGTITSKGVPYSFTQQINVI